MKKILETHRLYLRELTEDDAEHFYLLNADEEVIKYTGDVAFKSILEAKQFLENYNPYTQYGFGRWAVINKSNDEFLGWCGLKFSEELNEIDLGFRFFKKHWNQGYATESSKACINYAFTKLKINKIVGRAMQINTASIKVLEKIGMRFIDKCSFSLHEGVFYEIENK